MNYKTEFRDADALNLAAASFFVSQSHAALDRSGNFCVVLSGGTTPRGLFRLLATDKFWRAVPWDRTHVFWADERMVAPDHEWSNFRMAHELLLSKVPIPENNIHRIHGENGAKDAAREYRQELDSLFGTEAMPEMDLDLLGIGTDGHVASLFAGSPALNSNETIEPVIISPAMDTPTPAVDRVTMTLPCLNAARTVLFLVTGTDKAKALKEVSENKESIPAARIRAGQTLWYVDQAACPKR